MSDRKLPTYDVDFGEVGLVLCPRWITTTVFTIPRGNQFLSSHRLPPRAINIILTNLVIDSVLPEGLVIREETIGRDTRFTLQASSPLAVSSMDTFLTTLVVPCDEC